MLLRRNLLLQLGLLRRACCDATMRETPTLVARGHGLEMVAGMDICRISCGGKP